MVLILTTLGGACVAMGIFGKDRLGREGHVIALIAGLSLLGIAMAENSASDCATGWGPGGSYEDC